MLKHSSPTSTHLPGIVRLIKKWGCIKSFASFSESPLLHGFVEVLEWMNGLYLIRLPNREVLERVLSSGPWHVFHRPILLRG